MIRNRFWIALTLSLIFFGFGLATLPHYGINWDTINHLPRGQTYLNYFLTGKKDFSNRPPYFTDWPPAGNWYLQNPNNLFLDPDRPKDEVTSRSMYESPATQFDYFMQYDGGHPPLSDIFSAVFNRILFGKLKLINDVDAYRVYGVLLASALVGLIYYWAGEIYSSFAGLVASLSLALYPLFWSESHFNTEKDIPETVYWSFLVFSVWKGIKTRSWKWILLSGIFFGLALGTKFNILFSSLVVIPWTLFVLIKNKFKRNVWLVVSGVVAIVIGVGIFFGTWPFLWQDPIGKTLEIVQFYKTIGTTTKIDPRFLGPFGVNSYPIKWIIYTTPIVTLAFFIFGFLFTGRRIFKEKHAESLLFFLWLAVPITRATWPGATTYGGVRQLMEYIPALAIFAGAGGMIIRNVVIKILPKFRLSKIIYSLIVIILFVPITLKIIEIHPNENVYFNDLIGGLKGAKEKNIPYWGNTFGAAYRQGLSYINSYAPQGARVVFAYELIPNVPRLFLRQDLEVSNFYRSGYLKEGEYAMTLVYEGTEERSYYDRYLEKFMVPVYEANVDGVPIFKVWVNDSKHSKSGWSEKEERDIVYTTGENDITFDIGKLRKLSRLEISYYENSCSEIERGYVQISKDREIWERLPMTFPKEWKISALGPQPKDGHFIEPFAGEEARYIAIALSPSDACLKMIRDVKLFFYELEN